MAIPNRPRGRNDFKIAIFCALPLEAEAVQYVFDRCWEDEGENYDRALGDQNTYTTGVIGRHNVVLVHMPSMGNISAALSAAGLRSSYPGIRLAAVVGICGVVPVHTVTGEEIILGDVIVSTAVTQYDFGRQYDEGFRRKTEIDDSLGRANPEVRSFLNMLQTRPSRQRYIKKLAKLVHSTEFLQQSSAAKYPGAAKDQLYEASYLHRHRPKTVCEVCSKDNETCSKSCKEIGCEENALVVRTRHTSEASGQEGTIQNHTPTIHLGRFGSANTVMKSGRDRDRLAVSDTLIAFEMEGAGVWEQHPTVVIKAACDYADSHKAKGWQNYAAAMAAAFLKVFLSEWATAGQIVLQDSSSPVFHMPFDPVPGFVGRAGELARIKNKIFDLNGRRIVSILGLGGVGKSRLVQELVYQIRSEHPRSSIFWVQANDQLTFDKDILDIGKKLGIPGIEDGKADVRNLVKQRLTDSIENKWIMILDNADDETLWGRTANTNQPIGSLVDYLPKTTHGSIVITTRSRSVASLLAGKEVVDLAEPSENEAITMFTNALENTDRAANQAETLTLMEQLAYLPLAIVQASSYINRTQETVSTYLKLLSQTDDDKIELLSEHFEEPSGYRSGQLLHPVATTWLVSFERIRENHPLAARYLGFMACLLEKSIPLSLLPGDKPKDITDAMAVLQGYSFVKRQGGKAEPFAQDSLYDMHRLVHLATKNWLKTQGRLNDVIGDCIRRVAEVFPVANWKYRDKWKTYLPHSQHLCQDQQSEHSPEWCDLMQKMGDCIQMDGRYHEAVRILDIVVKWRENTQGASHLATLKARGDLGYALKGKGDLVAAEKYLRQAVDGQAKLLGATHEDIFHNQNSLALVYSNLGQYEKAKTLQIQSLVSARKVVGEEHPDTLTSMSNLALTYSRQGRHDEAEELQVKVLAVQTRVLGEEHPSTLTSMSNLALTYSDQGRHDEAEELQVKVLAVRTRVLGEEHPDTLTSMSNLASTYSDQGRHDEAEELQVKVLAVRTRVLGKEHPDTLLSMHNLAFSWKNLGRDQQAIGLMSSCVDLHLKVLGAEHPDTQLSQKWLLEWQSAQPQHENLSGKKDEDPSSEPEVHKVQGETKSDSSSKAMRRLTRLFQRHGRK